MKSISNLDFSLLTEKLPLLLQYARKSVPASDTKAANAIRILSALHRKLTRQNNLKPTHND